MPPAKPALQRELTETADCANFTSQNKGIISGPRRAPHSGSEYAGNIRAITSAAPKQSRAEASFQPRVPVITGEARYRGLMPVDGIISGQLGAAASSLSVKQRPRNGASDSIPELNGELTFKDMLRINGHVAGKVSSSKGTLIIDSSARVDAEIQVGVCIISGTVNGDIFAHDRVELGAGAIINGNISTGSITMKPGAVFHGDCRMLMKGSDET